MIVVVIVGLLATLALPAFTKAKRNSQNARFISDVRMFAGACETYILTNGDFPSDGGSGTLPAELAEYIKPTDFEVRSPLGGLYDIEVNDSGVTFAVGAVEITATDEQLLLIDVAYDDGDLSTGVYRAIRAAGYYRVITE